MARGQGLLNDAGTKIARGSASPDDMVELLQAEEQFATGTKVVTTDDRMTGSLLDMLG